ncbi:MAG: HU family DNA-binding protein [Negativicutes bacterium]|nr:HU family DNA-binding protein [Negativicutes bacterium]
MKKNDLVAAVAAKAEITKKAAEIATKAVFASIGEALAAGESVQIIGFGTFDVRKREARTGRNPQTGKEIKIPASKSPVFKAGKGLKELVNKK